MFWKTPVSEFLFNKIASLQGCNFIKTNSRCFRVKFDKFLRTLILKNICRWLLLTMLSKYSWNNILQEIYWCNVGPDHIQKQPLEVFCKKCVLKNFTLFTGKHLCWSLFLIKLQSFSPSTLLKRDSNTGVFLWILWNS